MAKCVLMIGFSIRKIKIALVMVLNIWCYKNPQECMRLCIKKAYFWLLKKVPWVFGLHSNQWFRHIDFFWQLASLKVPLDPLVLSLPVSKEREYRDDTLLILASVQARTDSLLYWQSVNQSLFTYSHLAAEDAVCMYRRPFAQEVEQK